MKNPPGRTRIKRIIILMSCAAAGLVVTALLLFLMSKLIMDMRDGSHASVKMPALVDLPNCSTQTQFEFDIESDIRNSRACETDADCELLYTGCPFGCDVAVDKNARERIALAVRAYRQYVNDNDCERCRSDCPVRDLKVMCENKVCVAAPKAAAGG
ncbi:MAG TPA: hypothetical protein VF268_12640 [Gammaproteobacteria bacterium]